MNMSLHTTVPTTRRQRQPEVPKLEEVKERDALLKTRQKRNFDSLHGTRELPSLDPGQLVWLPESGVTANVEEQVAPRSYLCSNAHCFSVSQVTYALTVSLVRRLMHTLVLSWETQCLR